MSRVRDARLCGNAGCWRVLRVVFWAKCVLVSDWLRVAGRRVLGVGLGSRLLFDARSRDDDSVVGGERSVVVIPERPCALRDWVECETGPPALCHARALSHAACTVDTAAATQEDIAAATKHLRREALPANADVAAEVQTRIHDFMSTMLMGGPQRDGGGAHDSSSESDDEAAAGRAAAAPLAVPDVPAELVEQVTAMGFTENAARKALVRTRLCVWFT